MRTNKVALLGCKRQPLLPSWFPPCRCGWVRRWPGRLRSSFPVCQPAGEPPLPVPERLRARLRRTHLRWWVPRVFCKNTPWALTTFAGEEKSCCIILRSSVLCILTEGLQWHHACSYLNQYISKYHQYCRNYKRNSQFKTLVNEVFMSPTKVLQN